MSVKGHFSGGYKAFSVNLKPRSILFLLTYKLFKRFLMVICNKVEHVALQLQELVPQMLCLVLIDLYHWQLRLQFLRFIHLRFVFLGLQTLLPCVLGNEGMLVLKQHRGGDVRFVQLFSVVVDGKVVLRAVPAFIAFFPGLKRLARSYWFF